jgi:hypothetical protein
VRVSECGYCDDTVRLCLRVELTRICFTGDAETRSRRFFEFFFFLGFARQAGVKKGGSQVRGPLLQGSPKSNICTKLCLAGGYKVWLVVVVGCLARMERRGVVVSAVVVSTGP